jgi:hypothetical protein
VMVILVVPGEEAAAEGAGILNAAETLGELWLVFQGLEMCLREGVGVGGMQPAMRLGDPHGDSVLELLHIPRQKFDRLICSRAYILVADEICWRWSWRAWHSWCANLSETL